MRRLYRSKKDRKIAGICGGIASYFQMDPSLVRLAAVFLFLVTGLFPVLFIYLIGWFVIPLKHT